MHHKVKVVKVEARGGEWVVGVGDGRLAAANNKLYCVLLTESCKTILH